MEAPSEPLTAEYLLRHADVFEALLESLWVCGLADVAPTQRATPSRRQQTLASTSLSNLLLPWTPSGAANDGQWAQLTASLMPTTPASAAGAVSPNQQQLQLPLKPALWLLVPTAARVAVHRHGMPASPTGAQVGDSASCIAVTLDGLLERAYANTRSAAGRNAALLTPSQLPSLNTGNTNAAAPSVSVSGNTVDTTTVSEGPSSASPLSLTQSALRERAAVESMVASLPPFIASGPQLRHLLLFGALSGFCVVYHHLLSAASRDTRLHPSIHVVSRAAFSLLVDSDFVMAAARDTALACVSASILATGAQWYWAIDRSSGTADGGGSSSASREVAQLWRRAITIWAEECFSRREHSTAALAILHLL